MDILKTTTFIAISSLLLACGGMQSKGKGDDATSDTTSTKKGAQSKISLKPLKGSPEFDNALLAMINPSKNAIPAGENTFNFEVKNYALRVQTKEEPENGLANSKKGQHIHFIIDNKPYHAHYKNKFKADLEEGQHVLVAFLSRSYHESVKNDNAYVVKLLNVGNAKVKKEIDITAPHLIYSRPKGTYSGKDAKRVMLDFYLLNTSLSQDANKVKATINGQTFTITQWQPMVIEGLPMGETTIKLELLDSEGKLIESPFNPVTRTITLKKEA